MCIVQLFIYETRYNNIQTQILFLNNQFNKIQKMIYNIVTKFISLLNFKNILCQFALFKCFGNLIDGVDQMNRLEIQININNSNNTIYKTI